LVSKSIGRGMRILSPQMSVRAHGFMGGGVYDAHLLRAMADLGASIDIPLMHDLEYEPHSGWRVFKVPIRRQFKLGWVLTNAVFFACGLWLKLRGRGYDFVRMHSPYHSGVACVALARLFGVPIFANVHHVESMPGWRLRLERWALQRASLVFALSEFAKAQIARAFGLDDARIRIVPAGLNPLKVPGDWRSVLSGMGLDLEGKRVLSFVGALDPRKNVEFLFDVITYLPDDVVLLVVGGDPTHMRGRLERLKRLLAEKRLGGRVHLLGMVTAEQKGAVLARTDVFVFPSLLEGFGMAVVEAMSLGVPCVVSNRASLPELVQDGENGFVVDPEDPRAFAGKIMQVLDDPALRARMGEKARASAKMYSWENTAYRQLSVLKEMLER